MEFIVKHELVWGYISSISFIAMIFIPDFIAGVTKSQRRGRTYYPKEQKIKKMKWVGIFLIPTCIFGLLWYLSCKT